MSLDPAQPSNLVTFIRFTDRLPRPLVIIFGLAALGLAALADYWLTSQGFAASIYYLLPIIALAWFLGWREALLATVLCAAFDLAIDLPRQYALGHYLLNGLFFLVICLGGAHWVSGLRTMVSYYFSGATWRASFKPMPIGQRFMIVPAHENSPPTQLPDDSTMQLIMDPGLAFGAGSHPTTQMCVAFLEQIVQPGDRILDLGCGTGILSIAAAKLGAAVALGVDIDPEAVRVARQNAALNGVDDKTEFRLGSLDTVLSADSGFVMADCQIVVANVLTDVILDFFTEGLAAALAPGSALILSGIRLEQAPSINQALQTANLRGVEQRQNGDWIAIAARAP